MFSWLCCRIMKVQHRAGYCFADQTHAYNAYCTIVIEANYETFLGSRNYSCSGSNLAYLEMRKWHNSGCNGKMLQRSARSTSNVAQ